jgi:hypothetical protein
MPSTIQESPPPVHWAKKYSTEIGIGLTVFAIIVFALAIWSALAPPPRPIMSVVVPQHWELDLDPSSPWRGIGNIVVKPGDTLEISAVGKYVWNSGADVPVQWKTVTPDGVWWTPAQLTPEQLPEQLPMRNAPCGGLLIRIAGANGRMYFLGQHLKIVISSGEGGLVQFMVNSRYTDVAYNTGYIHLTVSKQ